LEADWKTRLTTTPQRVTLKKQYRNNLVKRETDVVDEDFVGLWKEVIDILHQIGDRFDSQWRKRKRIIDSKVLMLLIFRLVTSKEKQGYSTTIDDLWDNCKKLKFDLPQKESVAASSFCEARKKLSEDIFKQANQEVIAAYAPEEYHYKWKGHQVYAVDGSKVTLPRKLIDAGYTTPNKGAYYPQGLLSCLYQVHSQMPVDFDLVSHGDERSCAKRHLDALEKDDVVVYDRGYYSQEMLYQHWKRGIHLVFRLTESKTNLINEFVTGSETDRGITVFPSATNLKILKKKNPKIEIVPLKLRLIKYEVDGNLYCLGTTLMDRERYPSEVFKDLYHSRWGVEELYKVSKRIMCIQDFHGHYERGVKQEIFAHFLLITLNRIFSNQVEKDLNADLNTDEEPEPPKQPRQSPEVVSTHAVAKRQVNFKNCIHVFARNLEELLWRPKRLACIIKETLKAIARRYQKVRPGRSYERRSRIPDPRWRIPKEKRTKKKIPITQTAAVGAFT
jgi:hypothetical protein